MSAMRIRSILAATDLSPECDEVLRAAAAIAARTGAAVHVLHAMEFDAAPYWELKALPVTFHGRVAAAEQALRDQVARCWFPGAWPAELRVMIFVAHRAIVEEAERVAADLIVMGPHARSQAARLGTTADRVVRTARVPCVLVRGALPIPAARVAVATDFSDVARGALDVALAWTRALAPAGPDAPPAEVVLVHAQGEGEPRGSEDALMASLNAEAEEALALAGGPVAGAVTGRVVRGERPAEALAGWAAENGVELFFVGTHGRSVVERALIGSVAARAARDLPCPVVLVPPALARPRGHATMADALGCVEAAVDFAPGGRVALAWAEHHLRPQALVLAHVIPERVPQGQRGAVATQAHGRLEALLAHTRSGGRAVIREGDPAAALAHVGDAFHPGVVVLGRARHSPLGSLPPTLAERIARRAHVPVLLPPRDGLGATHVVAALADVHSGPVLSWARALAQRLGVPLRCLHVAGQEEQRGDQRGLRAMTKAAGAELEVRWGDEEKVIAEAAGAHGMLVLGVRRHLLALVPGMVHRLVRGAAGGLLLVPHDREVASPRVETPSAARGDAAVEGPALASR